MLGVTIGIGQGWSECARHSASQMFAQTGIECLVIDHYPKIVPRSCRNPAWVKLWVQQHLDSIGIKEDLMIFDADLFCCSPWDPRECLGSYDFAWCIDPSKQIPAECDRLQLSRDHYGNSGLMLIKNGCKVLEVARKRFPSYGSWAEQSAVCEAVQNDLELKVKHLDPKFNRLVRKYQLPKALNISGVNLHFVGLLGDTELLRNTQRRLCSSNA